MTKESGIDMIAAERRRQIEVEGFDAAHDDRHDENDLAWAAVCYTAPKPVFKQVYDENGFRFVDPWPNWDDYWDKRPRRANGNLIGEDRTRREYVCDLVKAGALIAAEIDRVMRRSF
jgi:hypothetical protein